MYSCVINYLFFFCGCFPSPLFVVAPPRLEFLARERRVLFCLRAAYHRDVTALDGHLRGGMPPGASLAFVVVVTLCSDQRTRLAAFFF